MRDLTDQELEDIAQAMDLAIRHINSMSETASRYIALEKRACGLLQQRRRAAERAKIG